MQSSVQLQEEPLCQRDVSSTAKLFSFNQTVFMTERVWKDCVELIGANNQNVDELAILQRLRHVLFMASSALHGRVADLECEFNIHRIPNNATSCRAEQTTLMLVASTGEKNQPQITIKHSGE